MNASLITEWLRLISARSRSQSTVSFCHCISHLCSWWESQEVNSKYNRCIVMCEFKHLHLVFSWGFLTLWANPGWFKWISQWSLMVTNRWIPHCFTSFSPSACLPDPPMITDMKNMPAHLGKTAIMRCEAMAVPPASFEWFRDDHRWVHQCPHK